MGKSTKDKDSNRTNRTLLNKKEFLVQYKNSGCNVAVTCDAVKIGRQTYYDWLKTDQEFKQDCEDVYQGIKDNAESKLQDLINKLNVVAVIYFLKTKCRDRGYDEKHQIELTKPFKGIDLVDID